MKSSDGLPTCKFAPENKGFTKEEQKEILDVHNQFRTQVTISTRSFFAVQRATRQYWMGSISYIFIYLA